MTHPFASPTPWLPGTMIDGRWEVELTLGRGPMSVVLGVRDRLLNRPCALKLCAPSDEARERMLREARTLSSLWSRHVVRALSAGALSDGTPYLLLERLFGRDLHVELRVNGPMSVSDVGAALLSICDVLAEAHSLGILHRDLKPANVFRCDDGTYKLLDFGVAKGSADRTITGSNAFIGTLPYLSPEQVSGGLVDTRSDLWSLGVLTFRLLTGALPFGGSRNLVETAEQILQGRPRPLEVLRPDVPASLARVVDRCLQKAPEARFQSVQAFADAVRKAAAEDARTDSMGSIRL